MKFRTDFVTNSSSSSYIIVSSIDLCDELREHMKNEYGKYGARLLNELVGKLKFKDKYSRHYGIVEYNQCEYYFSEEEAEKLEDTFSDQPVLMARYYYWSTYGDREGDDAWLLGHIPKGFIGEEMKIDYD